MVRVIHLADDGSEVAVIEVDDFTIEVIYSGLAEMLHDAAAAVRPLGKPCSPLPREARQRRARGAAPPPRLSFDGATVPGPPGCRRAGVDRRGKGAPLR